MKQGHGFCRVGGWGGVRWSGSLGRRWHLSKVSWEVGSTGVEVEETAPQGPRGSQMCLWGRWGMGGPAGLIDPCVWNRTGLGSVCVCVCVRT